MKILQRLLIVLAILAIMAGGAAFFLKQIYVVPVLMYHAVDDKEALTKLSVCPAGFERQMAFLAKHRYNVVTLDTIVDYLEKKEPVPPRTVAITFDDGFLNNYTCAYPVLKKYRLPATIFMITGKIGQPGWCGWRELKEMSDSGLITIGSHTKSHLWLPTMGTRMLTAELADSKAILEKGLGRPVNFLCYPIGAHDDRVKEATRAAGYTGAVATNPGRFKPSDDPFAIKRIKISRTSDNLFVFWFETLGYYTWIKEHRDE